MTTPLIEAEELAALLAAAADDESADPADGSGAPIVLADVRWNLTGPSARPEYEAGHLPGAVWVDLESELAAPPGEGGRHPRPDPEVFATAMRRIGVGPRTLVIAYDGANSMAAARLWWLLRDAGHPAVQVLNGGYAAWVAAGGAVQTGPGPAPEPGEFTTRAAALPVAGAAAAALAGAAGRLVDVRAGERYRGEIEPMDPVAGHIPGARNVPATAALRGDGRFLPVTDLTVALAGVPADAVVYCGSGITASHTLLALAAVGREDAALYAGSWSDWIRDPGRPVATGTED